MATLSSSFFRRLGPGILVAATGVGAGDLITAGLAGSEVGLVLLWTAWVGALLKWMLNEGIARWQLATGTTLVAGWKLHLGKTVMALFGAYLVLWSLFVGSALIKACGVAGTALFGGDPFFWGVFHSLAGVGLIRMGGFRFFERCMGLSVGLMVICVLFSVTRLGVPLDLVLLQGLVVPSLPPGGLAWGLGVLGGVGGTVTLLSYGYWIQEAGRQGPEGLRTCWWDLAAGYSCTALFGMAMIVIGSQLEIDGQGAGVAREIANLLSQKVDPSLGLLFLVGFWAAVFSSLLGVWQSVPALAADLFGDGASTRFYWRYLFFLSLAPLLLQALPLKQIALLYAVLGSAFMPFLAATLLYLNGRCLSDPAWRNPWWIQLGLWATLLFFVYHGLSGLEAR